MNTRDTIKIVLEIVVVAKREELIHEPSRTMSNYFVEVEKRSRKMKYLIRIGLKSLK